MAMSKEHMVKIGKKTRFTSDKQPSSRAKSEGIRKKYEWERAKREMWKEFIFTVTPNGEEINIPEQTIKRWQELLLSKTVKNEKNEIIHGYSDQEKDDLIFKIIDKILPKETKVVNEEENSISIQIEFVEAKKKTNS